MVKTILMNEINVVLDAYCEECFLKKHLAKDKGKTAAHKFCITKCTVGDQLKFLSNQMNKFT